ncbi:unnamed protein product [Meloidogyne enterolobii]|uniref:Uncharacterized protein n=1 Tax=Meloidogyne enterolobii TaxID=390850 RepID=A0ACB0YYL8_MELEN
MSKFSLAYLGMQCFWGSESTFALLPGVLKTRVGYSGGTSPSPTYQNIGDHTEIVEIQFNPELTKFKEIINLFYSKHNFTLPQKTQYKSVILYVDEEQKKIALEELEKAKDYHQKYWLRCENDIFKEVLKYFYLNLLPLFKLNLTNSQLIKLWQQK